MSYLGQVELKSSEIRRIDVTGSTSATHTLTWTPASEQSLIITINGIKQQNNYSISGTTLTLDDALLSADKMEVIGILDIGLGTIPPDDSITNVMVKSDAAIALSKLATDPSNASNLASGTVPTARLGSGSASSSTYLAGDSSWSTIESGTSWQAVQTTSFTAVAGNGYPINTTAGEITVSLPATASVGDTIELVDYAGTFDTNKLTIDPQTLNFEGDSTTSRVMSKDREGARIVYVDATQGWVGVQAINEPAPAFSDTTYVTATGPDGASGVVVGDYKYHTFGTSKTGSAGFVVSDAGSVAGSNTVEYLIVAGGGGGGSQKTSGSYYGSGGGGAGGLGGNAIPVNGSPPSCWNVCIGISYALHTTLPSISFLIGIYVNSSFV